MSGLIISLCVFLFAPGSAEDESQRIDRLVGLCKAWSAVKYFHPYLAYRDIDWDAALVEAIPDVSAAQDPGEYAAAVQKMLDALGDPVTRVIPKATPVALEEGEPHPVFEFTEDDILVVKINRYADLTDYYRARQRMTSIARQIPKSEGILFDLRAPAPLDLGSRGYLSYLFEHGQIDARLCAEPVMLPGARTRMHTGFAPQAGMTSGGYKSGFLTTDGKKIAPGGDKRIPVVFLLNEHSEIPPVALGLQKAGAAAIVAEGSVSDASLVETFPLELTDGVQARMRMSELVFEDGPREIRPDLSLSGLPCTEEGDPAFAAAMDRVRDFRPSQACSKPLAACAAFTPDETYKEMSCPSREYRLLAAFRIWAVINYFFPYKEFMDKDWDAVLREFIPKMEKAEDARGYHLAVAEMVTHIQDSHGFVNSTELKKLFGEAPPPFRIRMIEGKPTVTSLRSEKVSKACNIEIGDVILEVDGEDAKVRMARYAKYKAASTPQRLWYYAASRMLNGPDGSKASVKVQGVDGSVREIDVPRKSAYWRGAPARSGEVTRLITDEIGYADLERLTPAQVDGMFEEFKDTKAIIFDMRGYPRGVAWSLAPRLAREPGKAAALFRKPCITSPDAPAGALKRETLAYTFTQHISRTDKRIYEGMTLMLIDERAISQAEHTGLFLRAANGTKFIGSPTAGANGDVTNFFVPGGVQIMFTGQAVMHPDGSPLQRVGLIPDVEVRPTIEGIRSGRDEVLEKAVEFAKRELGPGG